ALMRAYRDCTARTSRAKPSPASKSSTRSRNTPRYLNLRLHRTRNEAPLVRLMVHLVERGVVGRLAGECDRGPKLDARDGELAVGVLLQRAARIVGVAVDHQAALGGDGQERQHVAARERGDQRLFGVYAVGIAEVVGRGRGRDRDAAVERPCVVAAVA